MPPMEFVDYLFQTPSQLTTFLSDRARIVGVC